MALSYVRYEPSGRDYNVPFPYINRAHVSVSVDGNAVAFQWLSNTQVRLALEPPTGALWVEVRRTTPSNTRLVDFADGATLTEGDLDASAIQMLYLAQEGRDVAELALKALPSGEFDGRGEELGNIAEPTKPTSAANVAWTLKTLAEAVATVAERTTFVFVEADPSSGGGDATKRYHQHTQSEPSNLWVIKHDLNGYPIPTVFNSSGEFVFAGWSYDSLDQLRIEFAEPINGIAHVR